MKLNKLNHPNHLDEIFTYLKEPMLKEFEALKAASNQRFSHGIMGLIFKDNRDMIRRTVFVRAKNYSSIDDYIKKYG